VPDGAELFAFRVFFDFPVQHHWDHDPLKENHKIVSITAIDESIADGFWSLVVSSSEITFCYKSKSAFFRFTKSGCPIWFDQNITKGP